VDSMILIGSLAILALVGLAATIVGLEWLDHN
jgi:hypothetical protein